MSVLEQECMADKMNPVWVETDTGFYAAGYLETDTGPLYLFRDMQADAESLPAGGAVSSAVVMGPDELQGIQVIEMVAPVRYVKTADGRMAPGFFEPSHHVFFQWRADPRDPSQIDFNPGTDAISPEVDVRRITATVLVDAPADAAARQPL